MLPALPAPRHPGVLMAWVFPATLGLMAATWLAAVIRRSNRLNWAVALLAMILIAIDATGLIR